MSARAVAGASLAAALLALVLAAASQAVDLRSHPRLTGPEEAMGSAPAPQLARPETGAGRPMRNYPEQPPTIPHQIDGYELSLNANKCLTCHRRQYTEASGAPMISVTHFQDRDGQMLADVAPRRYFCTQCHVPQTDARALIGNTFTDMSRLTGDAQRP